MKKYLLSSLAVAGMMFCASAANAYDFNAPYIVGEAGYSFGQKSINDAGLLGIGAGYHINEFLRSDLIVSYRGWSKAKFKGEDGTGRADLWSIPVLANIYASMPFYKGVGVYATGGIGMAYNKTNSIDGARGKGRFNFAWNVGAGFEYQINRCWSLDLGYRYSDLGQARVSARDGYTGQTKKDVRSHDVKLSARYYF